MKKTIIAVACIMTLSSAAAFAQSSQGNVGPGTDNNMSREGGAMKNTTMPRSGTTGSGMSGSGMSNSNMGSTDNRPTSANPSSQGNAGPGTVPGK